MLSSSASSLQFDRPDLRGLPETAAWFAVWTRPRYERRVCEQLRSRGLRALFPTVARWSHWEDRRRPTEWPLFPGYCFVQIDPADAPRVLACTGVISLVGRHGRPLPIAPTEIASIQRLLASGLRFDPCPRVHEGEHVEVVTGPLQGMAGRLVRDGDAARLVVSVGALSQGVSVAVATGDVRPS